jgi:hypothetical protein
MKDTDKVLVWTSVVLVSLVALCLALRGKVRHKPQLDMKGSATQQPSHAPVQTSPLVSPESTSSSQRWQRSRIGPSSLYPPPDTAGSVDSRVTQENIYTTICVPGYTRAVRPQHSVSEGLKSRLMVELNLLAVTLLEEAVGDAIWESQELP